jgi:hypothetical protein
MLHANKSFFAPNPRLLAVLAIAASGLVMTGCGKSSAPEVDKAQASTPQAVAPAPAPETTAPVLAAVEPVVTAPPAKSDKLVIQGFASPVPSAWTPTQPSSTMRVAQFSLPAAAGAEAGELAAFFFRTGQGGSHEANIERWTSQFATADGKPVAPKISTSKGGDFTVTLVELQGTYARGVGMGPVGDAKPDQTLLVALVETPIGRITLQTYGPSKTIAAQRDNFVKLAKGFRPA